MRGLLVKPIEGIKEEGFVGGLKGIYKGISGLVFKPITGILDLASATADGIKQFAVDEKDKPPDKRNRYPRAFYGNFKYYKKYDS